jgi:S-formylglutathione hydrolase FrmB
MDPNATLTEIHEIQARLAAGQKHSRLQRADHERLAELCAALDAWLTAGGFLPTAWARPKRELLVWVLTITHGHGSSHTLHRTKAGARAALATYCRRGWGYVFDDGDEPERDDDVIAAYWAKQEQFDDREYYELNEETVGD